MRSFEQNPCIREWLSEEPFTLALSSGFFGFYAHAGSYDAILEANLSPAKVTGSSAGAMVAGLIASGVEPERMYRDLNSITRGDFWDPGIGMGLLKGNMFDRLLRGMMPVTDFDDAMVPAHLSVFDLKTRETEVVSRGDIPVAVRASCALPVLLQPVRIDGETKLDGGIRDHAGLEGANVQDRVLHINLARDPDRNVVRENLVSIHLTGLPQVTPLTLKRGVEAYSSAKSQVREALLTPIADQPSFL